MLPSPYTVQVQYDPDRLLSKSIDIDRLDRVENWCKQLLRRNHLPLREGLRRMWTMAVRHRSRSLCYVDIQRPSILVLKYTDSSSRTDKKRHKLARFDRAKTIVF